MDKSFENNYSFNSKKALEILEYEEKLKKEKIEKQPEKNNEEIER